MKTIVRAIDELFHVRSARLMQGIKETSTLRLSEKVLRKGEKPKPSPTIVCSVGNQNRQIRKFMQTRDFLLDFLDKRKTNNVQHE